MRLRYAYIVDGGKVPPHHHPHSIDINHDLDTDRITIGNNDDVNSIVDGEAKLCEDYEYVKLDFIQATSTSKVGTILKNKQPFTYEGFKRY